MKRSSPQKKFGMGYEKMHGFHGNLLYDSRDWGGGVGLQIQSYLGFYLSYTELLKKPDTFYFKLVNNKL